jgi:hypothetical protein
MEAPIYTQGQADYMLALEKRAEFEAQIWAITGQVRTGFISREFSAQAESVQEPVRYKIITQANFDAFAYSITLSGSLRDGPMQALCRYDVHDSFHLNSDCHCCPPPPEIHPGVLHVHRYNECAILEGRTWCKCATPLAVEPDQPIRLQLRQLIGIFISDMRLRFSDSSTMRELFGTGEP